MRGGGSWLPLFWLMVAFLIVVRIADITLPALKRRYKSWRERLSQTHRESAK